VKGLHGVLKVVSENNILPQAICKFAGLQDWVEEFSQG
jgi:hypothetical protein